MIIFTRKKIPTPLLVVLSALFWGSPLAAKALCFGPANGTVNIVYLHGMDSATPNAEEVANRRVLQTLAERHGYRIALPRGNGICRGREVCWKMEGEKGLISTYEHIIKETANCFGASFRNFGIIGFSNGGYFAAGVHNHCLKPQPKWIIASGSAEKGPTGGPCTPIHLLIGKKDITLKKTLKFHEALRKAGAITQLTEFDGGHRLPEKELASKILELESKK